MANSIVPDFLEANELLRLDAGFDWFHNFTWNTGDEANPIAVDLNNWNLTAQVFDSCGDQLIDSTTIVITELDPSAGQFEVRIPGETSDLFEFGGACFKNLSLVITAENVNADLGYNPDETLKLVAGTIIAYENNAVA